jgi:hypothetical protein
MLRKTSLVVFAVVVSLVAAVPAFAAAGGRPGSPIVIYVRSQDLYYDSIAGPNLPARGPFQKLERVEYEPGQFQLETDYGPGDHAFVGGRWWLDDDGDGIQGPEDTYFSCPLLGPGRAEP